MRVLETAAHLHFHFMHERLGVANPGFDFARFAQERAKFPRPPANESRLSLRSKRCQARAPVQTRLRFRAISRRGVAQRFLLHQDDAAVAGTLFRDPIRLPLVRSLVTLLELTQGARREESRNGADAACCLSRRHA